MTTRSGSASSASPRSPPASTIRTSSRSTTRARPTASCTSRCGTSRAPICERLLRAETRLEPGRAVSLISQAAAALDAAHAAGLVHRDVKPGNILLASDARSSSDRAFLSDFGVTKRLETGAGITRTGQFVGTVDYVSPEQIRGDDVDGRADVYSLGCVLYRCLTGEVPFPRDTEVATIYAHLQDPPPVPSERLPGLGVGFDAPIARALAKRPADRFDTCRDLADAAGAVVHLPARWPSTDSSRRSQPTTSRRRMAFVSGGLAVVAGGLAIAALLLFPRGNDGTEPSSSPSTSPSPLPELTWSAVDLGLAAPDDQEIADAAVVDGTIVAVGHDDAGGNRNAAVWTSSDGRRWTRASGTSLGTTGEQRMDAVATMGGDVVAVGSERIGGDVDAAVWRSADRGTSWDRVEGATSGLHEPGDQAMQVVVRGHTRRRGGGVRHRSRAVTSTPRSGRRRTAPAGHRLTQAALTGPGDQQIFGATTMDDRLIAVGSSASGVATSTRRCGCRADGEWTKVDDGYARWPRRPADRRRRGERHRTGRGGVVRLGRKRRRRGLDVRRRIGWDRVAASDVFGGAGDQRMSSVTSVGRDVVRGRLVHAGRARSGRSGLALRRRHRVEARAGARPSRAREVSRSARWSPSRRTDSWPRVRRISPVTSRLPPGSPSSRAPRPSG